MREMKSADFGTIGRTVFPVSGRNLHTFVLTVQNTMGKLLHFFQLITRKSLRSSCACPSRVGNARFSV